MGSICSKGNRTVNQAEKNEGGQELSKSFVQLVAPVPSKAEDLVVDLGSGTAERHSRLVSNPSLQVNVGSVRIPSNEIDKSTVIIERPSQGHYHQRRATLDVDSCVRQQAMSRIVSMPRGPEGEQILAGWPSWLTSVAGEAIQGWVPRRADSFEKLAKVGQGTYSSVYKARDLETGKIVAMKRVRFVNMDPESVRFMAREILILRKLDHPNVMKLEALVTSRMSCNLYLVFEYMEHDLAGLAARPGVKFTEPQIKCYMQQLFWGLTYCHGRGVLHRDIKGSNLLIDNNGFLKIGDFGLATFFHPDQKQPLTSRVVTLWYRAPELLLGTTEYGVAIDLWSAGCILAELFAGKPIMPGRTEVEQMHKIFKLCGSPSEAYWRKSKLPHATSFKPQQRYRRRVAETFKDFPSSALALIDVLLAVEPEDRGTAVSALQSEFFMTKPLPCEVSNLPKYPPSKEFDAKIRDEERRQKAVAVKGHGPESVRRGAREFKAAPSPEFSALKGQSTSHKFKPQGDVGSVLPLGPSRGAARNRSSHPQSVIHPSASSWNKRAKESKAELRTQKSHVSGTTDLYNGSHRKDERVSTKDTTTGYVPRKNRIHYSGPLMPPGGNIDDMLKEHERQIQQAVRNARFEKANTKNH